MKPCEKIACLGPEGSYSELAARAFCPQAEVLLCRSFLEIAERLKEGDADCAVFPIENSTQGGIRQNLDLMQQYEQFYAVAENTLAIDHRLVRKHGVPCEAVERIYSHEQALAQCQKYLYKTFPKAKYIATQSTAASLALLDEHSAGIVGAHLLSDEYVFSTENVADEKCNQTHFLLVKKHRESLPAQSKKIFVCVSLAHRPGTLLKLLQTINSFGLNLTKIESRPIPSVPGEYRFFIEIEGNIAEKTTQSALEELEKNCRSYRLIGAY